MTTTVFVNGVTLTDAGWFNDLNSLRYEVQLFLEDFGGGTSKTAAQNYAAWLAAFAALPAQNGGTIQLEEAGLYDFSTTITGDGTKRVTLEGRGSGSQGTTGTRIRFPAGVGGINFKNGASGYGGRSGVRKLRVIGQDVGVGTNDGLLMQANSFVIEDVCVSGFGRHGCYVYSGAVNDDAINANTFEVNKLACYSNFVNGFKAEGVNSNAGMILGLDCILNTDWGVYDLAVLGNTYIAPHSASNTAGGYRLGSGGSRVRIVGGYKEDDTFPGVQIDLGNNGRNRLDFLEMNSSVADNAASKSQITTNANGEVSTNRFVCGDASGQYVVLFSSGIFVDSGKTMQFRDSTQTYSWDMAAQSDQSMRVRQIAGSGPWNFISRRVCFAQGAAVAAANDLTLGDDGNLFRITGATQINRLVNTNWQGGSQVTLTCVTGFTVAHAQAGGGVNRPIYLNGGVNYVMTANDTLTLKYDSTETAWYEIGRAVI